MASMGGQKCTQVLALLLVHSSPKCATYKLPLFHQDPHHEHFVPHSSNRTPVLVASLHAINCNLSFLLSQQHVSLVALFASRPPAFIRSSLKELVRCLRCVYPLMLRHARFSSHLVSWSSADLRWFVSRLSTFHVASPVHGNTCPLRVSYYFPTLL